MADTEPTRKWIALIEDDGRFVRPLEDALTALKTDLRLITFRRVSEFETWLQGEGVSAAPAISEQESARANTLRLALFASEQFKTVDDLQALIAKMRMASAAEINFVLTTFDSAEKAMLKWLPSGAFNLIAKPYDDLLLQQHLRTALALDAKSGEAAVFSMKTHAVIEMLKPAPLTAVSEIGFMTRSDREVPLGRVTKFYGKVFGWRELLSVYARTLRQTKGPTENEWAVQLTWFGTTRDQLLQIRSRLPKNRDIAAEWKTTTPATKTTFFVIGDPSTPGAEISATLSRAFPMAAVRSWAEPPSAKEELPSEITALFVHMNWLHVVEKDSRLKSVPKIILTDKALKDEELRELSAKAIDALPLPTERNTMFKKISCLFPQLALAEESSMKTVAVSENLDVGQPIEIQEMSEAGLQMKYERTLPIGTFRRFVLWQPMETGLPVLTGRCYATEPDPGTPGRFINRFVFFGMSDREIKHVRLWIRDNYILSKQKG